MADCEMLTTCIFFNDKMANMPAMATLFKEHYCRRTPAACARLRIATTLGRPRVPADLFPNQDDRAKAIIAGE